MLFKEFVNPEKTRIRVYEASSIDWKVNEREYEVERISEDRYSVVIRGIEYKLFTYNPIKWGLMWLEEHQNPEDGSWSDSVGITSLAALAFLNAGYDETYPTVKKAIQYILAHQNPDGSFGWGTYETSTAVWALVATHNPDYHDEISAAKDWLIKAQSDEEDGTPPDDPCYGGWRYGISSHDGDLSNTQFALMALDAAYTELGLKKPDPNDPNGWVFKAIKFISRCQNRPASNDQPWAHDTTQPSYNDGGFIYHPRGWSLAGGTKSYGSMTAAGIWSLRLCGVDVNDGRIQDALKWLAKNEDGSFDDNPGHPYDQPHCFLYYYYLTFAKALTMCFLQKLGEVDWYTALSSKLIDLENNDGHWVNAPAAHGQEDIPDLATSYAILTLQVRQIPAEIKSLSWLTIILRSNADLHVYDPLGRHVGKNYGTGKIEIQIPNATYIYNEFQSIKVPELESGDYRIVLVGTGNGSYTLNVTGGVGNTTVSEYTYTGNITKGEVHDSIVNVAMITWLTIHVEKPIPVQAMVRSSTGTGNVSFISDAGTIENLTAVNESKLPTEGKPALSFPHGFFSFTITGLAVGQTINVTIFFPSNIPDNTQYWKYQIHKGWYQIPIRSNDGDNIIIIQLTDGGIGDDDGIANGVIVDAGGPGVPIYVPKPPAVVVIPNATAPGCIVAILIAGQNAETCGIEIRDPVNALVYAKQVTLSKGTGSVRWGISPDARIGTYTVYVTCTMSGSAAPATLNVTPLVGGEIRKDYTPFASTLAVAAIAAVFFILLKRELRS
jgi:squalene-hopene/tetraprenyl-beta-curcumene cyclase